LQTFNEKRHQQYAAACICLTWLSPRKIEKQPEITAVIINKVSLFKNEIISVSVSRTKTAIVL